MKTHPPAEITHVEYGTDPTSNRPRVKVRFLDTESKKRYHVDFWYYDSLDADGIILRSLGNDDAEFEASGYWSLCGFGGSGASDKRDALFRIAMVQMAVDHLRTEENLNIRFESGENGARPSPRFQEPDYVWCYAPRGKKRHLAAARDSTSFCGQVDVSSPRTLDNDFDIESHFVCKTCRKKYYEQTENNGEC